MRPFKFFQGNKTETLRATDFYGNVAVVVRTYEEWRSFVQMINPDMRPNTTGGVFTKDNVTFRCIVYQRNIWGEMFDLFYVYGSYQNPEYQDNRYHEMINYLRAVIRR